jgi:hypothetical protein
LCEIVRIKRTQVAEVGRIQRAWTSESWETYQTRKAGISTQRRTCQKALFFLLGCSKAVFFCWPLSSKLSNKNSRTHKLLLLLRNHRFFTWVWEQPKLPASSSSAPAPWALQISSEQGLQKKKKSRRGSFSCKMWLHDFFKHWVVQETTMQQQPQLPGFITTTKKHKSKQHTSTLPCDSRNSLIPGRIYQSPIEAASFFLPRHCTFPAQLG